MSVKADTASDTHPNSVKRAPSTVATASQFFEENVTENMDARFYARRIHESNNALSNADFFSAWYSLDPLQVEGAVERYGDKVLFIWFPCVRRNISKAVAKNAILHPAVAREVRRYIRLLLSLSNDAESSDVPQAIRRALAAGHEDKVKPLIRHFRAAKYHDPKLKAFRWANIVATDFTKDLLFVKEFARDLNRLDAIFAVSENSDPLSPVDCPLEREIVLSLHVRLWISKRFALLRDWGFRKFTSLCNMFRRLSKQWLS